MVVLVLLCSMEGRLVVLFSLASERAIQGRVVGSGTVVVEGGNGLERVRIEEMEVGRRVQELERLDAGWACCGGLGVVSLAGLYPTVYRQGVSEGLGWLVWRELGVSGCLRLSEAINLWRGGMVVEGERVRRRDGLGKRGGVGGWTTGYCPGFEDI